MDDTSVKLSAVHFDIAISVCEKVGRWREILALATAMGGRGITPHSVTCNAVLKAQLFIALLCFIADSLLFL